MMFYIVNLELLNSKAKLLTTLQKIYGIGFLRAKKILVVFGYNLDIRISEIKKSDFRLISRFIEKNFLINENLKRIIYNRIKNFIDIKSVKGIKHSLGLPVRGQRTHTNAGTTYRLKFNKGRGRVKIRKKNKNK